MAPRVVEFFKEKNIFIIDMACGKNFMLTLDNNENVYSYGNNDLSQLGHEFTVRIQSTPKKLNLREAPVKICCGWTHGMVLTAEANIFIWGNPFFEYNNKIPNITFPIKVYNLQKVIKIASGFHHFAAIVEKDSTNNIYTWGINDYGQLGYSTESDINLVPKEVNITEFEGTPNKVNNYKL